MNKNLNFSPQGYHIIRQLGENLSGGNATYLATETKTKLPVVIKQFKFAQSGASWTEYETYQQEVEVLKRLSHPNIPLYLNDFETPNGLCLVTEYKPAHSVVFEQNFSLEEIKEIAIGILEILVYLQQQNPPIIHGNIKPENILVDRNGRIQTYLIGFGGGSQIEEEIVTPSAIEGTLGFMPPEKILKHPLNQASDLYSLGASIICLLMEVRSQDVSQLLDETYAFNLESLESKVSPKFIQWLSKMVAPKVKDRYPNAAAALTALKATPVVKSFSFSTLFEGLHTKVLPPLAAIAALSVAAGFISSFRNTLITDPVSTNLNAPKTNSNLAKLLKSGQCAYCDLYGANLKEANLQGVNLHFANLQQANLQGSMLQGANLQTSNLKEAMLQGANLSGAYPRDANLVRAKLNGANLFGADLSLSNLREAQLRGANLEAAKLKETKLESAYLEGAKLQDADLRYAYLGFAFLDNVNLTGAELNFANLESASLYSAYLKDTNMNSAFLKGANLQNANLENANLTNANLEGANLTNANLRGANLKGANLRNADLRGAKLRHTDLIGANLEGAIMPNGLLWRRGW